MSMFKSFEEPVMEELLEASKTLDAQLEQQLRDKYRTFTRFNYREAYFEAQKREKRKAEQTKTIEPDIAMALQLFLKNSLLGDQPKLERKNRGVEELPGVKSERRERFRQTGNTFQVIKHYIEREGFKPREEETYLMTQLAEIKEYCDHSSLDSLLKKIYRIMNEAVDLNELRFLCLLVMLAADVCLHFKEPTRAFYFYNQGRVFASYAHLYEVKIEALTQLGVIAMEVRAYTEAILLFKKALQYAWKMRNTEAELLVYDHIGSACYYQGNLKDSQYYHRRFAQGESEQGDSAIKRLSAEMLEEYCAHLQPLESTHLTSLFLEYIQIPIVDHAFLPPPPSHAHKHYDNYDDQGLSPRHRKTSKIYDLQEFPPVQRQLAELQQDPEFLTEIPNPDVQRNFLAVHRFGRPRKEIGFEQSAECHKLMRRAEGQSGKREARTLEVQTFERRLEKALTARNNADWWGEMKDRIRKGQAQKIGTMKDRIYNSHQSYAKYPEERRRAHSLRGQKIKQSFNKTLLDWIDPLK